MQPSPGHRVHRIGAAAVWACLLCACVAEEQPAANPPIVLEPRADAIIDDAEASDAGAGPDDPDTSAADAALDAVACIGSSCDETLCSPENPFGDCPAEATCRGGACVVVDWQPEPFDRDAIERDLETIWARVDENYAAFEAKTLDWPSIREIYRARLAQAMSRAEAIWIIVQMVSEIGDGHTFAAEIESCATALPYVQNVSDLGACLDEDEAGVFVYDAQPGNRTGLQVGDRLIGIDGRSAEDAVRDRLAQPRCTISASSPAMARRAALHSLLYRGRDGELLHIERAVDGRAERIDLVAAREDALRGCDGRIEPAGLADYGAGVRAGRLGDDAFYIWFPFFGSFDARGALVDGPILESLRSAMRDALDAPGLVLDLRSNGGGYPSVYTALASWLYFEETPLFGCRNKIGPGRDDFGQPYTLTAFPDPSLGFDGPVAVLINARTFSAGDFASGFLGWTGRAATFGEPSGGGFGSAGTVDAGEAWSVGVNTTACFDLEGTLREGNPPPVDFPVGPTAAAAAEGRDAVIEAALDWLRE